MIISKESQEYLTDKIPKESLDRGNTCEVLIEIDRWLAKNGFAPPKYYDYSDEGRKMQNVRDRIYEDNVLNKKIAY